MTSFVGLHPNRHREAKRDGVHQVGRAIDAFLGLSSTAWRGSSGWPWPRSWQPPSATSLLARHPVEPRHARRRMGAGRASDPAAEARRPKKILA